MHFQYWWNLKIWLFTSNLTLRVKANCPQNNRDLNKGSGPNLVILAWMGDELWCRQAQNWANLDFQVKFDLEDQGRSLHKTIGTLTKVFGICGPNLVILAWMGPELSRGQASDWQTDRQTPTHTHTPTQATAIPEGQNWPRVKMERASPTSQSVNTCGSSQRAITLPRSWISPVIWNQSLSGWTSRIRSAVCRACTELATSHWQMKGNIISQLLF